jgi:serine-type D-Ala-D-Ala endopeptidase (penicillin-binding protein 7)
LLSAVLLGLALAPSSHAEDEARDRIITAKAATLNIKSAAALVLDQDEDRVLYTKNEDAVMPIASITKLMTGLVVLEEKLPLDEVVTISREDVDGIKGTRSRLRVGLALTRDDLLRLALMSSENRAAAALARAYPGGKTAFVEAMNQKAVELGMWNTRFADGTGLSRENVATAQDLVRLVSAAHEHSKIREYSTDISHTVVLANGQRLRFWNSNRLVNNPHWDIGLSKTGYISEAGRCLVLQARIAATPVIIVLLESWGKNTRIGDANRIKRWMESNITRQPAS